MNKKEIKSLEEIRTLVDSFYDKVRGDALLKDIFNDRIQNHWPEHLEKMYRFWTTVLLGEAAYHGSPFLPHTSLPIELKHFERWLQLFHETLEEHFYGDKAEEAKRRASQMAAMFHHKIKHLKAST
jgi:hemoglobin